MTDEAKALVERLRDFVIAEDIDLAADRIETLETQLESANEALRERLDICETQAREIERLREGHREVFEQWAGSEGFIPETAPEGYLLHLTKRMADIARAALAGDSHD